MSPSPSEQPEPIPVLLLTGFLGSGKTTLLSDALRTVLGPDTGVVINEFGTVAVDHDLVQVGRGELMQTTTGCLCCHAGSDVEESLGRIVEAMGPDGERRLRLMVVETTGLADPAPVVNQLRAFPPPATGRGFQLAGVITTVDAATALVSLDGHLEAAKQIAFADQVVLTKTDLLDADGRSALDGLTAAIRDLNPTVHIHDRQAAGFDIGAVFTPRGYDVAARGEDVRDWLALEQVLGTADRHGPADAATGARHARHGGGVTSFVLTSEATLSRDGFYRFLRTLQLSAGPKLLRMKGLVVFTDEPDRPYSVHQVQHMLSMPKPLEAWPSEDRRSRLVFIVEGIDPAPLAELFKAAAEERGSFLDSLIADSLGKWFKSGKAKT
ncbi:GTP-binding protein [Pannonibacter tanglangensis]|uniref:GTP-binding protein n=1 Tax=Pannonibacter tanglangensis TaxID=2750084 RepID=A0ABW9ZM24_9HYPH|nr:GTP-binding protein [Pannonibacter sp. XCT-34]